MKIDDITTAQKNKPVPEQPIVSIRRNLVPSVVATNKKEFIDFSRKFEKEEKARKE